MPPANMPACLTLAYHGWPSVLETDQEGSSSSDDASVDERSGRLQYLSIEHRVELDEVLVSVGLLSVPVSLPHPSA